MALPANSVTCGDLDGLTVSDRYYPQALPPIGHTATSADLARMADLVNTYESLPLGTTDASVVAVAERLGLTDVATLDRPHFTVVRPRHVDALTPAALKRLPDSEGA